MTEPTSSKFASRTLAALFFLLAIGLAVSLGMQFREVADWNSASRTWAWLVAGLSLFLSLMFAQTGWRDRRSNSVLRLDWFLPAIKKLPKKSTPSRSMLGKLIRKLAPGVQSDWQTKRRGRARKVLQLLGLSWVASPLRRLSQTVCLLLFGWLFFYVCWPYHARPSEPRELGTLSFVSFDQELGIAKFLASDGPIKTDTSKNIFLRNESPLAGEEPQLLGEFRLIENAGQETSLKLVGELSPLLLDVITGVAESKEFLATDEDPTAWPSHYAKNLESKEFLQAELFLLIDPLVSLSTAIASRSWVWSLGCAAAILLVCVIIPRGFCGYLCPLGTTIDLFDWAIAGRTSRFQVSGDGWWVHVKYYLLAAILMCAAGGILISGFFSAIPVVTRGYLFLLDPLQSGFARGWHLIPSMNLGHFVSIGLFLAVLCLGFLRPRFWCKYVCPSGAVFSVGNLVRVTERKVESSCIHCNKCVEICPFDAIKPDFTTRTTDCTLCQSCAGVCPTHAIKFVERTNLVQLKVENKPTTNETSIGRRGFLSLTAGTAASVAGAASALVIEKAYGAKLDSADPYLPVRPPGSVPEPEFLEMCIRCGECFKACPNNVLQPESFQQGFEGLWTPVVEANWAGCESSCNACGQVCPTGAIRALPLEEKRYARMGLAIVNESTCLPFAGKEACDLCVQECDAAGYHAIEYTQVGVETDEAGRPIEGTGYAAPVVLDDQCVGCGLCQTRCYAINVKERRVLSESAIIVEAGEGKEDRLMVGSYRQLHLDRMAEASVSEASAQKTGALNVEPSQATTSAAAEPKEANTDAAPDSERITDPFGIGAAETPDDESPF